MRQIHLPLNGYPNTINLVGLSRQDVLELRDNLQYTSKPALREIRELLERALTTPCGGV
jgi:hypothetical protein